MNYECHVISLARQPEKLAAFLERNRSTGLAFKPFAGVDGNLLTERDAVGGGLLAENAVGYTKGALGCAASHRALWQRSVTEQVDLLIFEDDVYCRHDIASHVPALLATVPQWDIVLLGFNTDAVLDVQMAPGKSSAGFFPDPYPSAAMLEVFAGKLVDVTLRRLNNAFGTCAYLISPGGAAKLLSVFPMDNRPVFVPGNRRRHGRDTFSCLTIDMLANTLYRDIEAYVSIPPLALPLNDPATSTTRRR